MEGITEMGIRELRQQLSDRLDAAYHRNEPTIIRNVRRDRPTAALVPYPWLEELEDLRATVAAYRDKFGPLES